MRYLLLALTMGAWAEDVTRVDHFVKVKSAAPAMKGETAQIYVREVVLPGMALRGANWEDRVVLFVHGAGTPAEVAFDVPYQDYSWMAFLARAGFDVFAMDLTGYGRSTRPTVMNEPCHLTMEQQRALLGKPCATTSTAPATEMASDWHDIDTVVEHVRRLRGVERVNLIGWSLGGPRTGGYTASHPERVGRLVLLAPAYARAGQANRAAAAPLNTQARSEFDANWDRQLGCPAQVDPQARETVWREMLASDPVGATWGTGVRRAPNVGGWHPWSLEMVAKMKTPALFVAAALDQQALPANVRQLHTDYGAENKVLLDLGCASHNALWEKNHGLLFQASLEFLREGQVEGRRSGVVKLGY